MKFTNSKSRKNVRRVSENRNSKAKKETFSAIRLPKDYPWQVLRALKEDLANSCDEKFLEQMDLIIRSRDPKAYMDFSQDWSLQCINSSNGNDIGQIRSHYQLVSLLKKFPFHGSSQDRINSATKKFIKAEIDCNNYNQYGYKGLFVSDLPSRNVIIFAKGWIEKILGHELPEFDEWTLRSRHGPGASTGTRNGLTSKYFKYAEVPYDCTVRARGYAVAAIKSDQRWSNALQTWYRRKHNIPEYHNVMHEDFWDDVLNIVPGNKIAFVPKSFETDRTIAVEPTMNLYLQLGVDGFIRRRLKRWGIDLDSQEKNCELARQGSLVDDENSFVTLDLASASDSISTRLCREILPPAWYDLLMDLRSPIGILGERKIRYAKISSMGNGYTFALESLIFASVVYGVIKEQFGNVDSRDYAVYGDDIIVRKHCVLKVVHFLKMFGFKLNLDKSFLEGPVRESCGADWFKGKPLRPVQISKFPQNVKDLFNDINRLKRIKTLRFGDKGCTDSLISRWIPFDYKNIKGPYSDEEFDTYLHTPSPQGKWVNSCWKIPRVVLVAKTFTGSRVESFEFRKLMASLNPTNDEMFFHQWKKKKSVTGSNFDVVNPKGFHVRHVISASSFWGSEYAERHIA